MLVPSYKYLLFSSILIYDFTVLFTRSSLNVNNDKHIFFKKRYQSNPR